MKIKQLEWYYMENGNTKMWNNFLAYQYPDEKCGDIYNGYEIINTTDEMFELLLCDSWLAILPSLEGTKEYAQKHWESIILGAIEND